jgi:hypothetical protein
MAKGKSTVSLPNYEKVIKTLDKMSTTDSEKVIKRCTSDAMTRAPAWVSASIAEVYSVKKADIKETLQGKGKGNGKIKVKGKVVESVALIYKGRLLTPIHFKMRPGARKDKPYRITQEIFKGQRKALPPDAFLASSGKEGSKQIPFQREGKGRHPIRSIKTVSVPQMIGNEEVSEKIQQRIDEGLTKRLENHIKQMISKAGGQG